MAKIVIENKEYEVNDGQNLLEVCLTLGYDLPYFCWHSALGSVGACRQCAVKKFKNEDDTKGKLVTACMEPIVDNLRVSISDFEAVQFRKTVVEWLMTNHPHDCAICDEGGECHLQDMTVMTGHNYRRFQFNKRTHNNQYLGPLINHEMNRCIQCYRCVRFYKDYAGGDDFDVFSTHNNVYFGRAEDGVLENEFSGNLIEICPTGVFTDKTLKKHYTRKWDLTSAPSVCEHCSVGCNTLVGERYGSLRRVLSRYNGEVNGYFLCDKGRFGYEYNYDSTRIKQPFIKSKDGSFSSIDTNEAAKKATALISGSKKVIGIGSPRASLEANYALKKLVTADNFYSGIGRHQHGMIKRIQEIMVNHPVKSPTIKEIAECDAVVILGEDLTNTAPIMALSVRQSIRQKPNERAVELNIPEWQDAAVRELVQQEKGPLYLATPFATKLEDVSTKNVYATPEEIAGLGFAIAQILDSDAPKVEVSKEIQTLAKEIAKELKQAKKPLIISGTSCGESLLIEAASNLAQACFKNNPETKLSYVVPECNSMGLVMLDNKPLDEIIEDNAKIDTLIVLENDLFQQKDKKTIAELFSRVDNLIVLDYLTTATTKEADLLLSSTTTAESEGTFINQEGRSQRFYQAFKPKEEIQEAWRWLSKIEKQVLKKPGSTTHFDTTLEDLVSSESQFVQIKELSPPSGFRIAGQKVARESHRYSGRTSIHAHEKVSEDKPVEDTDSPLTYTMEGYHGIPPSSLTPFYWSPGWNSVQSINKYQIEVGGALHDGDPGIRLLEPKDDASIKYYRKKVESRANQNGKLFTVPKHHIFGSGELSRRSPAIAELAPEPYIGISKEDAEKHNLRDGDPITLHTNQQQVTEKAKITNGLPGGMLAIPIELEEFWTITGMQQVEIKKNEP